VRISPISDSEVGIVDYTMTCHSGGTLDIFIEPVLPKPHLVILGRSPIAQTLARLAKSIYYRVSVAAPEADLAQFPDVDHLQTNLDLASLKISSDSFVVVSTGGRQLPCGLGTGFHKTNSTRKNRHRRDIKKEVALEGEVTRILREKFSFRFIEIENEMHRMGDRGT
jgi:hypothetical protein